MALSLNVDPGSAKLQTSFQKLSASANTLNKASDDFTNAIVSLDTAINNLNPGVTAWITISSSQQGDDGPVQEERLGYAKTNGRWGLSLCIVTFDSGGADGDGEEKVESSWLFNDAPRSLRLLAIDRVAALIEALARQAEDTANRVTQGADLALQLARSVNAVVTGKETRR